MHRPLALISTVLLGSLAQPALALDAQSFLDRVKAVYETMGYVIEFGPGKLKGDALGVRSMRIGLFDASLGAPLTFTTPINFLGVTEREDGAYFVREALIPDLDMIVAEEPVGRLTLSGIRLTDLYVPATDPVPFDDLMQLVGSIETGPLVLTRNGNPFLNFASIRYANQFTPEQGKPLETVAIQFAIDGIELNLADLAAEDAQARPVIEFLGLEQISGDITQSYSWDMRDGRIIMDEFRIASAELGALDMEFEMTGLTPELFAPLYPASTSSGMTPEQSKAAEEAGMALLQKSTLVSAHMRYEDASLADKLLDFHARNHGLDRAAVVDLLKQGLPQVLASAGIGDAAATAALVPAVSAFLDNPESLDVHLQPATPTNIMALIATATNPAALLSALKLTMTANTPATGNATP